MESRHISQAVVLSTIVVAVLLLGHLGIGLAADFFPLKIGQTMTYTVTYGSGGPLPTTQTAKVTGVTAIFPNKIYYNLDFKEGGEYRTLQFRSTATALYRYKGFGLEYMPWQNAATGTSWTYVDEEGNTVEATVEAVESVTVPAGTYDGCLKIHSRVPAISNSDVYNWIKPGVGLIKEEDYMTQYPPKTMKLKSVSIP